MDILQTCSLLGYNQGIDSGGNAPKLFGPLSKITFFNTIQPKQ